MRPGRKDAHGTAPSTSEEPTKSAPPARKLFVNLAVRDLPRSVAFFTTLGFAFDPRFTDAQAACMIVSEHASVMLLTRPFFRRFTTRELCDTRSHVEGLLALSCESRAEVDALVARAIEAGGTTVRAPVDHGSMYASSFHDLDGHHWEVVWVDAPMLH